MREAGRERRRATENDREKLKGDMERNKVAVGERGQQKKMKVVK